MARSRKKTPIAPIAATSDKQDKAWANRRERHLVRMRIDSGQVEAPLPIQREVSDVWGFAKDGKARYDCEPGAKSMRK